MKKLLLILLLICFSAYANVEFLNNSNFNNKISKGIVVVEYWADWNKGNQFTGLEKLKDCIINSLKYLFLNSSFFRGVIPFMSLSLYFLSTLVIL